MEIPHPLHDIGGYRFDGTSVFLFKVCSVKELLIAIKHFLKLYFHKLILRFLLAWLPLRIQEKMHTFIELRILYFVRNFYFSSHADCFSSFIMLFDDFLKKLFYNVLRRFQAVSTFSAWILGSYLLIQEKTRADLTKRYKLTQK